MITHELYHYCVVADPAVFVPIPCPSHAVISKLRVVISAGTFNVTLYNRAFTAPAVNLFTITAAGTKTKLTFLAPHKLRVGDQATVAGSSVGGYNVVHVVTSIIDDMTLVTDRTYTADGTYGTCALSIQANNYPLFEIVPNLASSGTLAKIGDVQFNLNPVVVNQDPPGAMGQPKLMYAKFSAAGTYWLTMSVQCD